MTSLIELLLAKMLLHLRLVWVEEGLNGCATAGQEIENVLVGLAVGCVKPRKSMLSHLHRVEMRIQGCGIALL